MRQRGTVRRAGEEGVYVELSGGGMELSWESFSDERFYHLAKRYAEETAGAHRLLADFCEAAGLADLAEIEREKAEASGK